MQTSPITSSIGSYPVSTSAYSYARQTTYERQDLSVSYSDGTNSVRLSLSQEVLTDTVIYTETGAPVREPMMNATAKDAAGAATEAENALIEDAFARYAELITERVDFLLRRIAEARSKLNGNASEIPGTESTARSQASMFYLEDTIVVNRSLTIEADIADPGLYSPEQTASRIVDFALSFYDGGDRTAYAAKIKAAVIKGFEQALGAMGGVLPQESYDTITLATDAIDQWAAAGTDITA